MINWKTAIFSLVFTEEAVNACDICLVIGTSSVVLPASAFAPRIAQSGVPVAEFNLESTPCSEFFQLVRFDFHYWRNSSVYSRHKLPSYQYNFFKVSVCRSMYSDSPKGIVGGINSRTWHNFSFFIYHHFNIKKWIVFW